MNRSKDTNERSRRRGMPVWGFVAALVSGLLLAVPAVSGADNGLPLPPVLPVLPVLPVPPVLPLPPVGGGVLPVVSVSVCQVNIVAGVTKYVQLKLSVDQLNVFIGEHPGSFEGTCPAGGGNGGGGGIGGGVVPVNAGVSVCRVTGSASVPSFAQAAVALEQLGVYLNRNPGSFVGSCPAGGAPAGSPGLLPNGFVTLCSLTGSLSAPRFAQLTVALSDLQAALNRQPGSFAGACPTAGDVNGDPGLVPSGFATICRLTGNATTPYATLTVALSQLGVYLNQAGNIMAAPTGGCPTAVPGGAGPGGGGTVAGGSGPGSEPGTSPASSGPGRTSTLVVQTTPNTVVTAQGAGTKSKAKSNARGRAMLKLRPTKKGIITIRAGGGKLVKRIGVSGPHSGGELTG